MASEQTHEKEQLHELVERLAPGQVHAVRDLLQVMLDPVSRAIANAPVDDEPLTAEDAHALEEAASGSSGTSRSRMSRSWPSSASRSKKSRTTGNRREADR